MQLGIAVAHHRLSPVIGGGHPLWTRRKERGQFHITRTHAKQAAALAGAPALHRGAHHAVRKRRNRTIIQCPQQNGLRATAATAGHGDAFGIHIRQIGQKIQRPNSVPRLQAHDRLQPQLGLGAVKPPILFALHRRALRAEAMRQLIRQLRAVRVADHVEEQHHIAEARKRGGTGHLGHAAGFLVFLRTDFDLIENRRFTVRLQAPAMSVRT